MNYDVNLPLSPNIFDLYMDHKTTILISSRMGSCMYPYIQKELAIVNSIVDC